VRTCLRDAQGWLATFELSEGVRDDARVTIAALREQGIEVQLWSGDAGPSVARVAALVGIAQTRSGCTPQDKLAFLHAAQQGGRKVAMVGDGLNDGPVLAAAQVAFAVGQAVPLAKAQVDFVVTGERLFRVVQAMRLARRTLRIVRQNLGWAVVYNLVCVPLAMAGWMPAWLAGLGMAASSLLVVLNALRLASGAEFERNA
jgi:Cu2+-exporting ATPase